MEHFPELYSYFQTWWYCRWEIINCIWKVECDVWIALLVLNKEINGIQVPYTLNVNSPNNRRELNSLFPCQQSVLHCCVFSYSGNQNLHNLTILRRKYWGTLGDFRPFQIHIVYRIFLITDILSRIQMIFEWCVEYVINLTACEKRNTTKYFTMSWFLSI